MKKNRFIFYCIILVTYTGLVAAQSLPEQWEIPATHIYQSDDTTIVLLARSMQFLPDEYRYFQGSTKSITIDGKKVVFKKPVYVAIVIDDVPMNWTYFKTTFLTMSIPMTFSVLPFEPNAAVHARMIIDAGFDVQIHMPMEPEGYPAVSPGHKAVFTSHTTEELIALIDEACASLPFAVGMNNHMGSRATAERNTLLPIFVRLKQKGMYFLDSKTSPKSVGKKTAEETGVLFIENYFFLDDSNRTQDVSSYLQKCADHALSHGYAVAIGHPYKETYEALMQSIVVMQRMGIEFVTVRELIMLQRSPFYERYGY